MNIENYKDHGYKRVGAAFEVSNDRGSGMAEESDQKSLEIEHGMRGTRFVEKQELVCFYKGREVKRRHVSDLFGYEASGVELQAVTQPTTEHEAQPINHLRLTRRSVGTLFHLGHKGTLEWKCMIFPEFLSSQSAQISAD